MEQDNNDYYLYTDDFEESLRKDFERMYDEFDEDFDTSLFPSTTNTEDSQRNDRNWMEEITEDLDKIKIETEERSHTVAAATIEEDAAGNDFETAMDEDDDDGEEMRSSSTEK